MLDAEPLGTRGLLIAQLGVLAAGHRVGAVVRPGVPQDARAPVALALSALAAASVIAVATP